MIPAQYHSTAIYAAYSNHRKLTGCAAVHTMVAVIPEAICAQALSVADRNADSLVAAEAFLHAVRPPYATHTSQRNFWFPKLV